MASALVRIPRLLAEVGDGRVEVPVEGATVTGALESLFAAVPALRVHVLDETGNVRPHVSVFHDGRRVDAGRLGERMEDGDVVTILQAVSGGSDSRFRAASTPCSG